MIIRKIASFVLCAAAALCIATPAAAYTGRLYDGNGTLVGKANEYGIDYCDIYVLGTKLYDKNGNFAMYFVNPPYKNGLAYVSSGEQLGIFDEDDKTIAYLVGSTYNYYHTPVNGTHCHDANGNRYYYLDKQFIQENNCIYDNSGQVVGYCTDDCLSIINANADRSQLYDLDGVKIADEDNSGGTPASSDNDYYTESSDYSYDGKLPDGAVRPRTTGFDYLSTDVHGSLFSGKYYSGKNAYFKDEAEIFTESQYGALCEKIQETVDTSGMGIAVFTGGNYRSDLQTENFTADANEEIFGKDPDVNSIFLYLDFEGKSLSYDFIDTYHDAKLYYPKGGFDDRIEEMLDDLYKYLPKSGHTIYREDIKSAVEIFCKDVKDYHDRGMVWESSYRNAEDGLFRHCVLGMVIKTPFPPYKFWGVFLIGGIILGLLVSASKVSSIRAKYKFRETQNASSYTSRNRISFNDVRDVFLREHTSSYRVQSSSSGSGHHHSSGGGHRSSSHGGGGRHR